MGILGHRHDDDTPHRRFQMRERMLDIGDDYWIEDENGNRAFLVDGKVMRMRNTWVLKDPSGNEVAEIKEHKLGRDNMVISLPGDREAKVTKKLIGIRDRFKVEVDGGSDLEVKGDIIDHEYEIERDGHKVAEISKKWFRVRETYGVEILGAVEPVLIIGITVAVDGLTRGDGT